MRWCGRAAIAGEVLRTSPSVSVVDRDEALEFRRARAQHASGLIAIPICAVRSKHTKWIEIRGGNHSQFGHYGHQLFDGDATITREAQQEITRRALLESLVHLPLSQGTRRSSHGAVAPLGT
jgi:hypothetical protein